MVARSALMQVEVRAILVGLEPRQASLPAISVLTGLHWEMKLHSTEADGVPTS